MSDVPQKIAYYIIVPADIKAGEPAQIVGWNAVSYPADSTVPEFSPGDGYATYLMEGMTQEKWDDLRYNQNGCGGGLAYDNDQIVPYTPYIHTPSLADQAAVAMQKVQQQAAMAFAMGQEFGPQMKSYVQALQAIINGSDTTSTTLPTAPAEPNT